MAVGLVCTSALAQTVPDAGQILQQLERERRPALPPRVAPEATSTPLQLPAGATITVREFRFNGNALIDSDALAAVVTPWLGRPLGFAELEQAAAAVVAHYRKAGWVVRASLPRQDVTSGVVAIAIVEARFGGTRIEAQSDLRFERTVALRRIEKAQPTGQPLNAKTLDRALLLLDDLPGVTASGQLIRGEGADETALVLKLANEPLLRGDVGLDNAGGRSTGEQRLSANLAVNSPLSLGDQLSANLVHTEGSDYGRVAYSLPLPGAAGDAGWRAAFSAGNLDYRVITPEFASLNSRGHSQTLGADLSYPLLRGREANLYLGLGYEQKTFNNEANNALVSSYVVDNSNVNLNGNVFDKLGGSGANAASLTLSQGNVQLGSLQSGEIASTQGIFTKLRWSLSRQQAINKELSLYGAVNGQRADRELDSSERFYLGGSSGVRAYPANEGGGSEGQLATLELRQQLNPQLSLAGFYDWGQVRQRLDGNTSPNEYTLAGFGLSLAWLSSHGVSVRATWARRDGSNPNPTSTGKDQDGSAAADRFWLAANFLF